MDSRALRGQVGETEWRMRVDLAACYRLSGSPTIFTGRMGYEGFASADLRSLRLCFSGVGRAAGGDAASLGGRHRLRGRRGLRAERGRAGAHLQAAVVGVPDTYRGEALVGFAVCRSTDVRADELQRHLAERLVKYRIPGDLRIVDTLPKTVVGKTDKTRLREIARAG